MKLFEQGLPYHTDPGSVYVILEYFKSDFDMADYGTLYVLTWRVRGERKTNDYGETYSSILTSGRRLLVVAPSDANAMAIREAIVQHDALVEQYGEKKDD